MIPFQEYLLFFTKSAENNSVFSSYSICIPLIFPGCSIRFYLFPSFRSCSEKFLSQNTISFHKYILYLLIFFINLSSFYMNLQNYDDL